MKANTTSMEMVAAFVEKGLFFKTKRVTERDRKAIGQFVRLSQDGSLPHCQPNNSQTGQ